MLFHATRHARSAEKIRVLIGSMLTGWALGLFDLVEGIIDHQILGIHHVFPGHPLQFWSDMLFLVGGGVFAMIGGLLFRLSRN